MALKNEIIKSFIFNSNEASSYLSINLEIKLNKQIIVLNTISFIISINKYFSSYFFSSIDNNNYP